MAGDIRKADEEPHDALNVPKDSSNKAFSAQVWQDWKTQHPGNANMMPGGTYNSAGGKPKEISLIDEIKSITWEDFKNIHNIPCAREAFLTGIGGAFGAGAVRTIVGGPVIKACNWAVGTWIFSSVGMWEFCQRRRTTEKQGMKRAVEVLDKKRLEKAEAQARKMREERLTREEATRIAAEEEEKRKRESWWKLWR
ncbi:MAG: hypothetical protein M1834_006445 [Cirrosporium novae-zelandiae]|nr:MAG: hypothetical protein M1834_006445 [Cirrosporium novae-zelandiae]